MKALTLLSFGFLLITTAFAQPSSPQIDGAFLSTEKDDVQAPNGRNEQTSSAVFDMTDGEEKHPIDYVNPFIGTGKHGNCVPAAKAPFGMISLGPNTMFTQAEYEEYYGRPGYKYSQTEIYGFGMTHFSGVGCYGMQDLQFLPVPGKFDESPVNNKGAYKSSFFHSREDASPGYYEVDLVDYNIDVKMTVDQRAGISVIDFGDNPKTGLVFQPTNSANGISDGELIIDTINNEVSGWVTTGGFCWRDPSDRPYTVYFVAQFDTDITKCGVWKGEDKFESQSQIAGDDIGAYVAFGKTGHNTVKMKTALSYTNIDNARLNLDGEIPHWEFAKVLQYTREHWAEYLNRIQVEGGSNKDKETFYTALYHNFWHANVFSDLNGAYIGFDDQIHKVEEGRTKYVNFSLWDTYRTTAQLQAMLAPEIAEDMIWSLHQDAIQGGAYPNWSMNNVEYGVMSGYSAFPFIANMHAFGAEIPDMEEVKEMMLKVSREHIKCKGYHGFKNVEDYMKLGYVPLEKESYGASVTLEYGIDDYSIASICQSAGDSNAAKYYRDRSLGYKHLFDDSTKLIRPKYANGEFLSPFDKSTTKGYNEGNAAQYFWSVPHDIDNLIEMAGGKTFVEDRLDLFMSEISTGWAPEKPFYWIGNEPCFGVVYVYNFLNKPWKSQYHVRQLMSYFDNTPDGIPGDDDAGAMSALYVFKALGLYPYMPGEGGFLMTGPLFEKTTIHLTSGQSIVMKGQGAGENNCYVKSLTKDGQEWSSAWIDWDELSRGAVLEFEMSDQPDKSWGQLKQ